AYDRDAPGPRYLREELRFPYVEGGLFVEHLFRHGGWRAVDAAYRRPPVSTEQILHPERYPGDAPLSLRIATQIAPGPRARRIYDDVLGERGIRAMLRQQGLPERDAADVAAGWDGDRACVWDDEGRLSLAWTTAWDTPADARAFADRYRALLMRWYRVRTSTRRSDDE